MPYMVDFIEDLFTLVSKTAEVLLLVILGVLYYIEMARSVDKCGCYPMKYLSKQ